MQIWKLCDKKWRHDDVITRNKGKMQTSKKSVKLYIIWKVLNYLSNFVKSYGHLSEILAFYHKHSPNMVKSYDPGANFENL